MTPAEKMSDSSRASLRHFLSAALIFGAGLDDKRDARTMALEAFDEWFALIDPQASTAGVAAAPPLEPTEAMLVAGGRTLTAGPPGDKYTAQAAAVWRAMLAASPTAAPKEEAPQHENGSAVLPANWVGPTPLKIGPTSEGEPVATWQSDTGDGRTWCDCSEANARAAEKHGFKARVLYTRPIAADTQEERFSWGLDGMEHDSNGAWVRSSASGLELLESANRRLRVSAPDTQGDAKDAGVSLDQVEALAKQMWRGEPVPGRVLRFGAAVLGLVDATKEKNYGR